MSFADPDAEAAAVAARLAATPADDPTEGASDAVAPDDDTGATESDGVGPTVPAEPLAAEAGPSDGLTASPDAERVPPCLPRWSPAGSPEKDIPAATAASATAPTAPAAASTRREGRPPVRCAARRRCARPPGSGPDPGSGVRTLGSSAVSSYAFSHPWAAAGSAYRSYEAGSVSAYG
ncbi:hypothetical protein [Streptomyces sp. B4I13]|uniref:hypothetical protein n=1 Tax=Streptomyces sp. B4I13 TaxID=3042271 RepID=UPI0027D8FA9C|nr:hypothetical protein [Streptomyces sp. B4I13]